MRRTRRVLAWLLSATVWVSGCSSSLPSEHATQATNCAATQQGAKRPAATLIRTLVKAQLLPEQVELRDPAVLKSIAELVQTAIAQPTLPSDPDVTFMLWPENAVQPIKMEWQSGSHNFRIWQNDGLPIELMADGQKCVLPVARAVNLALAGDCPVSPVGSPSEHLAMGRQDKEVWLVDGGQIWHSGKNNKVLWLMPKGNGTPMVTLTSKDSPAVLPVDVRGSSSDSGTVGGLLTIPSAGCWTMTVARADAVLGAVTLRVR